LWDAAGHTENAGRAHEEAAQAALDTLAFGQAERHYARALELAGLARDERWQRLTVQRAHALVRMGKNAEAARLYASAAAGAEGELRVRLRIWVAQNLIQGAQVEEGLRAAAELFRELGIPFAESDGKAVGRIAWEGFKLKWRGIALSTKHRSPAPAERLALDALNELAQPVTSLQFLRGAALSAQHVRRALRAGDPAHAARALAYEGMLRTARKPSVDHSALFERAQELAESTGDPAVIASVQVRRGIACMGKQDFRGSRDCLLAAHELISTQCPGQPWLLTTARMHLGCAWHFLGEHASLVAHSGGWVTDAKQRGDSHAYAALSGYGFGSYRHLMHGNPGAALSELAEAMAPWPNEPMSVNQVGALWGTLDALIFEGGGAGLLCLERNRDRLQKSPLVRSRTMKLPMAGWEANAALAAMQAPPSAGSKLLQHVVTQIRILRSLSSPLSIAVADLLSGVLSTLEGKREQAHTEVQAARSALVALHHNLTTPALYLEGWLEGGAAGDAKCEEALRARRAEGWADPMRGISLCLPIFHLLPPR
jgi:hypothetical protein